MKAKPTVRGITKDYIRREFNLNEHRKSVQTTKFLGSVDITEFTGSYDKVKPEVFLDFFKEKFKDADLVEIYTDYDSTEFNLYREVSTRETNGEVVLRLQKEQKAIIQAENKETKQRAEYERLKTIYEGK